uniref:Uncharacterized protein n=1 Tax=Streptomyces sp. FR1 TaxID=349971 RepID=V9Z3V9_9ACTN|nr:hypothetical protein pFRL3_440 [Streptomyces sp. FR1]
MRLRAAGAFVRHGGLLCPRVRHAVLLLKGPLTWPFTPWSGGRRVPVEALLPGPSASCRSCARTLRLGRITTVFRTAVGQLLRSVARLPRDALLFVAPSWSRDRTATWAAVRVWDGVWVSGGVGAWHTKVWWLSRSRLAEVPVSVRWPATLRSTG